MVVTLTRPAKLQGGGGKEEREEYDIICVYFWLHMMIILEDQRFDHNIVNNPCSRMIATIDSMTSIL